MVTIRKRHEADFLRQTAVAPVVVAHLDRHFHGGGAIVREETAGQIRRRQRHQPLGETYRRLVGEAGEYDMFEFAQLRDEGRIDARIGMPEEIDPPGTHRIEIALAVKILEPGAGTAPDRDHRQGFMVLHLRAWMPHDAKVAYGERC